MCRFTPVKYHFAFVDFRSISDFDKTISRFWALLVCNTTPLPLLILFPRRHSLWSRSIGQESLRTLARTRPCSHIYLLPTNLSSLYCFVVAVSQYYMPGFVSRPLIRKDLIASFFLPVSLFYTHATICYKVWQRRQRPRQENHSCNRNFFVLNSTVPRNFLHFLDI